MEIKQGFIFPKPFWSTEINLNNKVLENECYQIKKNIPGVVKSNSGKNSYHSPNLLNLKNSPEILKLIKQITFCVKFIHQQSKKEDVKLESFWININGSGGLNKPHTHSGNTYSGVFYIKVPNKMKEGNLLFLKDHNERFVQESMGNFKEGYRPLPTDLSKLPVKPVENLLMIFPSWLPHSVEPNDVEEERISLSFNFTLLP